MEQDLEKKGSRYFKKNKITASVQIVPKNHLEAQTNKAEEGDKSQTITT